MIRSPYSRISFHNHHITYATVLIMTMAQVATAVTLAISEIEKLEIIIDDLKKSIQTVNSTIGLLDPDTIRQNVQVKLALDKKELDKGEAEIRKVG